jgi:hypothetical protein
MVYKNNDTFPSWNFEDDKLNKLVGGVRKRIIFQSNLLQTVLGSGNEATKGQFIADILASVIEPFEFEKNLHVRRERSLTGNETQGRVEFVFSANLTKEYPIILLIEAKKDDFDQGRAQC